MGLSPMPIAMQALSEMADFMRANRFPQHTTEKVKWKDSQSIKREERVALCGC